MTRYVAILLAVLGFAPNTGLADAPPPAPTVAAIEIRPLPGPADLRENVQQLVRNAVHAGAGFIVLPEYTLSGAPDEHSAGDVPAEPLTGPAVSSALRLARSSRAWIAAGVAEDDGRGGFYSSVVLASPSGKIEWVHRKVLVRSGREDGNARRGPFRAVQEAVDVGGVRVGVIAGNDIRVGIPRLASRGADFILVSAMWPSDDVPSWIELCREFATQHNLPIAVANGGGGGTGVYLPNGAWRETQDSIAAARLDISHPRWAPASALGLPPEVPTPNDQPGSDELAAIGARIFSDPNLSSTGTVSCASCHVSDKGFSNGERKGVGVHGRETKRNVPTLLNVAFRPVLQWDGYASTLENFAKYPISGTSEMDFHYLDQVPAYINSQPGYAQAFQRVLGIEHVEFPHVASALAAYERTLISANSAFDKYYFGRDSDALSDSAKRGLELFQGQAGCANCHRIGERYALFMDYQFHVLGVGYSAETGRFADNGLAGISTDAQKGLFLTPSLRDVARTAPYMHDGSLAKLEDVIEFYDKGAIPNPWRDPLIRPLNLTARQKQDLLAFLHSLSGELNAAPWETTSE